jgi:uncharacterized protein YndB with AHSA1/START domain
MSTMPDIEHSTYIAVLPETVFDAITTGAGWDAWFTDGTTVDPVPGGHITLRWRDFGAGRWTTEDGGPVIDVEPSKRFVFQWSPGSKPTTVSFGLEPRGPGTIVRLRETGYSTTDEDVEACIGCAVGWGEALTLLKFFLEHGATYGAVPPPKEP